MSEGLLFCLVLVICSVLVALEGWNDRFIAERERRTKKPRKRPLPYPLWLSRASRLELKRLVAEKIKAGAELSSDDWKVVYSASDTWRRANWKNVRKGAKK